MYETIVWCTQEGATTTTTTTTQSVTSAETTSQVSQFDHTPDVRHRQTLTASVASAASEPAIEPFTSADTVQVRDLSRLDFFLREGNSPLPKV